ncbi:hypothetical protein [Filimonas effusa]|uniref:Uncharacterized protein n=1 Tax=Filimonas effusa TaxID=2508721 RepID=A0A4Q1D1C2_9BACT|nr:hypothetical protein [Filimonas effusa]RXK80779.1 hypothetical protein ESB13_21700 [Filimonas effusa]
MDFNELVKLIIEPTLFLADFSAGKEMRGSIEYEHRLLKLSFSYDYNSSYEVGVFLIFKGNNIFYEYNQLKVLYCNKDLDLTAIQLKDEDALKRWLLNVNKILNENLNEVINNAAEVRRKLEEIRQLQVNRFQQERKIKRFNEAVEKYWRAKDYSGLVNFLKDYNKPIEGSVKLKYDYALKMCDNGE